jgi:hypothetical protein
MFGLGWLVLWFLTPLSTIFQLYRGSAYGWSLEQKSTCLTFDQALLCDKDIDDDVMTSRMSFLILNRY